VDDEVCLSNHVGVAVQDLAEAMPDLQPPFGYELTRVPLTIPSKKSPLLLSRGPADTGTGTGCALRAELPIDRTLKKGGGNLSRVLFGADINAAIEHLTQQGSMLLSGPCPQWL